MSYPLDNYRQLTARIDELCGAITASLGEQITCSPGCSSCCTSITIFPVEAAALREELYNLPDSQADEIRRHVAEHATGERCPLLSLHHCLLYRARPIICRTHGLPIIYTTEEGRSSDCCPLNLSGAEAVSGAHVVDIDKLNTLLVAVNSIFLSQTGHPDTATRVTIAEALTSLKETKSRSRD